MALGILGCGSSMTPPMVGGPPPTMSGSFGMTAVSTSSGTLVFGGPIQSTPTGSVTATMRVDKTACFDFFTPLTFTGNISSGGQLSMTSSPFQSQTVTVSGMVSSDGTTISGGTFSISGGCAAGVHGTLTGFQVPLVNATYSGSFTAGGSTIGVTVVLNQFNNPNNFGLSGSAAFTNGSACGLTSANIISGETGFIAGADVRAGMMDSTVTLVANLNGTLTDATIKSFQGTLGLPNGPCTGTVVSVTLTKI